MRALVLAGGRGTRLRPLTDTRPKPLVPFMGASFAAGLVRRLQAAGCDRVTFLVGSSARPFEPLRELGAAIGVAVDIATEEAPLDTAGAVRRALKTEPQRVLVCNGDILTDLDYASLVQVHDRAGWLATIALTRVDDPSPFGVVTTQERGRVTAFVEKPAPGTEPADTVNAGTYVLEPAAFAGMADDGPLSFEREVFPALLASQPGIGGVVAEAYWSDLGTPQRYRDGHAAVLDGRCRWPVPSGLHVRMDHTAVHETATVDDTAVIGSGTVVGEEGQVGAGADLRASVVLARARIGANAIIDGCIVGEGATLGARVEALNGAVIGDGASVRPGVRLPAGTRVGAHAVIEETPSQVS